MSSESSIEKTSLVRDIKVYELIEILNSYDHGATVLIEGYENEHFHRNVLSVSIKIRQFVDSNDGELFVSLEAINK
jgi:hypothetical protein